MDSNGHPCGTILESAHEQGYYTGLVTTSRVTHATPGAFSAHVTNRDNETFIAEHQLGFYSEDYQRYVDLMIGGGKCYFKHINETGSCRKNARDIKREAEAKGWQFFFNLTEFHSLSCETPFPIAVLLADGVFPPLIILGLSSI